MDKVDHSESFVQEVLETLTRMLYADLVPLLLEDPSLRALLPRETSSLALGSTIASGELASSAKQKELISRADICSMWCTIFCRYMPDLYAGHVLL